ncbi:MAG: hypothetical protein AAB646_00990 [Patescibacteria group bacterium]
MKKIAITSLVALLPFLAFAQAPAGPLTTVTSLSDIIRIIETIVNWIFAFLMLLTTVFVLYAAYLYLTAAGNEENVKKAKDVILYAAVAVAVALLSRAVVFIVAGIVR